MPKLTHEDYKYAVRKLGLKSQYSYDNRESAMFHCCYHSDWSPSLSINFMEGIFHCFQCGGSGTINSLVKDRTGTNIYNFIGKTGDIDEFDSVYNEISTKTKVIERIVDPVGVRGTMMPYYENENAKAYVKRRGISEKTAMNMKYAYTKEAYVNGTHFVDRLMIPIYDDKGNMINVEGRALNSEDPTKCLYPKAGTKPIYGWYMLSRSDPLYVFEGIIKMSVARSDPFFTNSTATLGSMVSDYQFEQLNLFDSVVLVRDMDDAGYKMAKKMKEKYNGKFKVWLTSDDRIKDVDEIPTELGISVKEFREKGGFVEDIEFI